MRSFEKNNYIDLRRVKVHNRLEILVLIEVALVSKRHHLLECPHPSPYSLPNLYPHVVALTAPYVTLLCGVTYIIRKQG